MNTQPNSESVAPRMEHWKAAPEVMKAMMGLEGAVAQLGIPTSLLELIKLRVSQVNGCAYCVDMHSRDAKKKGETDQRLNLLAFWEETNLFTPAEKAVLRWAEALTKLSQNHVTDADFAEMAAHYSEAEITHITLAIVAINGWNRFGVGFRPTIGKLP